MDNSIPLSLPVGEWVTEVEIRGGRVSLRNECKLTSLIVNADSLTLTFEQYGEPRRRLSLLKQSRSVVIAILRLNFAGIAGLTLRKDAPDGELPETPSEFRSHFESFHYLSRVASSRYEVDVSDWELSFTATEARLGIEPPGGLGGGK